MPPDLRFFIDRSLGKKYLAEMLTEAGELFELHDHHYAQDTPDTEWLKDVGEKAWVVLTKDKNIRKRQDELAVLKEANNAVFVFTGHHATGPEIAAAYRKALPKMKALYCSPETGQNQRDFKFLI